MPNSYAIINDEWRYIQYSDGSEELYDVRNDPNEWENRAADKELEPIRKQMKALAPQAFAPRAWSCSCSRTTRRS